MSDDNRPSIAELQRDIERVAAQQRGWTYSRDRIETAAPALLEIAAAALALGPVLVYLEGPLSDRLRDALAKVRP